MWTWRVFAETVTIVPKYFTSGTCTWNLSLWMLHWNNMPTIYSYEYICVLIPLYKALHLKVQWDNFFELTLKLIMIMTSITTQNSSMKIIFYKDQKHDKLLIETLLLSRICNSVLYHIKTINNNLSPTGVCLLSCS